MTARTFARIVVTAAAVMAFGAQTAQAAISADSTGAGSVSVTDSNPWDSNPWD